MSTVAALLAFGGVLLLVALISSRWTPLIGIGGLLIAIAVVRFLTA